MIAMLKAAALQKPERPVWFIHGARDGRFHAFRQEVMATVQAKSNLSVHYAYSRPRPEDAGSYQSEGYVEASLIRSLVHGDAEYFLCGSAPFMAAIRSGLKEAGVPDQRVQFEMFTRAARSEPSPAVDAPLPAAVTFSRSQRTVQWQGEQESLLDFAEAQGLSPEFSCRAGLCGTCACRLLEGEVSYLVPPTAAVAPGSVLVCIARPKTARLSLDL
jgi:ferredoxin-NADP reductase